MLNHLKVRLLGELLFYLPEKDEWKRPSELFAKGVGKKQLAFLTYLLLNHHRKISADELIQNFWPEHSKDPANSLKNTMHKTRAFLKTILPDCEETIITDAGGYVWSEMLTVETDIDQFEQLFEQFKQTKNQERIDLANEAFELYHGDILPDYPQDWLNHLNTYYRSVYMDLVKELVNAIQEEGNWEKTAHICQQAYQFAPEVEEITSNFMLALISLGSPSLAIQHYKHYRKMLWQEYSLVPSEIIEKIYTQATEYSVNEESYEKELLDQVLEAPATMSSFQCSQLVFKNLLQLELRNMERYNHDSSVIFLHTGKHIANQPPSTDTRRVERILLSSLRAGDPFTKMNTGSFMILLSSASEENARKVMRRVQENFRKAYPHSKAELKYSIYPLKIDKK